MRTQLIINLHNREEIEYFKDAMRYAVELCERDLQAEDVSESVINRIWLAKAEFNEIAETIRKHTSSGDYPIPSTLKFQ